VAQLIGMTPNVNPSSSATSSATSKGDAHKIHIHQQLAGENRELRQLESRLSTLLSERHQLDGYCYFLYGLVLKALGQTSSAIDMLVRACNAQPLLWSAWKTLALLCSEANAV
jgi:hypothetical protein